MLKKNDKNIINARKIKKMRYIAGLIMCSIVIVVTLVSLTLNIVNHYNEPAHVSGVGTLKSFASLSNIIAALAAAICVPFQIDGLRKNRYLLPKWVVIIMFIGTTGMLLTSLIAIFYSFISMSFYDSMIKNSNIFMHTINPLLVVVLFALIISDVHLKITHSLYAIIPTILYAIFYAIMVFITHNWEDSYHIQDAIPWPLAFLIFIIVSFAIAELLRFLHNRINKYVEGHIEKYYKESPDYEFNRITDALAKLAEEEANFYRKGDDFYIPVDIIKLLSERYNNSSLSLDIQYDIYLEHYLANIKKKTNE